MTMRRVGVLGGLGPAATVDFLDQLVRLTPVRRDQDHLPVLAAFLPQVPDRSAAILGQGPDPLPGLLEGIALLNQSDVGVIAIPCNSAHHWYAQLSARSKAPILHIARACAQRLQLPPGTPVLVLGTRGVQRSGLYAQALRAVGLLEVRADDLGLQDDVDRCIAQVKAGERQTAADTLMQVLAQARAQGLTWVILGCTELPVAARACERLGPGVIDSTRALAEAVIAHMGAALAGPGVEGHP
jgi:aspartate racemase